MRYTNRTTNKMGVVIGTLDVSDTLIVSDPCYVPDSLCHGSLTEKLQVKPGRWQATVDEADEGSWGRRIASMTLRLQGGAEKTDREVGIVGVDSGQMMMLSGDALRRWEDEDYDLQPFPGNPTEEDNPQHVGMLTYNGACLATLGEKKAGVLTGKAFVSSTGYGDGGYPLEVGYDGEGKAVRVTVHFLWDEDEEEDWGDEEEGDE